jgi:hypothetical protein
VDRFGAMFRIFRTIRNDTLSERTTRRYLSYSIGEIVLVVIGILIALQINNWNEERLEQREITEFAHALMKDVERDLAMIEPIIAQMEYLKKKIDGLAAYMQGKSIDQIRNIDLFYFMRVPYYRPYSWSRTALEQIKSSGALRQMKNRLLAERISAYDAVTRHLDEDFAHDRRIGSNASALANRVVNRNYPDASEVLPSGAQGYFVPRSRLLQAYESTDLPLLTNDIEEVRIAVNNFLELGGRMGITSRVENHMPALVADAQELIELLNAEYPE